MILMMRYDTDDEIIFEDRRRSQMLNERVHLGDRLISVQRHETLRKSVRLLTGR
jgi:hypothetical protein